MKRTLTLLTFALACTSLPAHATEIGGNSGGGGKGVVCRDHGKIKSVELLDLWEARELFKRTIVKSSKPVSEQVASNIVAMANIADGEETNWSDLKQEDESMPVVLQERLTSIANLFLKSDARVQRLHGITLNPVDDSFEAARPVNCAIEQLVNFDDTGDGARVLVNQDLIGKMDRTNQAALVLHEALYRYLRTMDGEKNSLRVRRAIGYVFGGQTFPTIESVVGSKYVSCETAENAQVTSPGYTLVYFFTDAKGLVQSVSPTRFGQYTVGAFASHEPYGYFSSLEQIFDFQGQACDQKDSTAVGNVPDALSGPVDFETFGAIVTGCDHGKNEVWASAHLVGSTMLPDAERLTCKWVDKTK